MEPRLKASLLWGLVSLLSFLVLVQGYELVADVWLGFPTKVAIAVLVGCCAVGVTYVADRRLVRGPGPE